MTRIKKKNPDISTSWKLLIILYPVVQFAERQGTIVNVSSLMGKVAAPTMATYSATKFAIVGFTQALRIELAPYNVKMIALLPSLTDTDMVRGLKLFRWVTPMTPEEVAQALIRGIEKDSSEILVGWQSHLAVLCQRNFPWLLEKILLLASPYSFYPLSESSKKVDKSRST